MAKASLSPAAVFVRKMTQLTTPLIFVFRGEQWPSYVEHSLTLALETAQSPIIVLSDLPPIENLVGVSWKSIWSFYEGKEFQSFAKDSGLPAEFRSGFWLHAVERFFILNSYAEHAGLKSFFHGELDCLFFNLPPLEEEIEKSGRRGFFFPRETVDRGLGSLIYVNDIQALSAVCQHFLDNASLGTSDASSGNEMHLLGLLPMGSNDGAFHSLPTAEAIFRPHSKLSWPIVQSTSFSLTDGAVLGRWVFGMDPANTGGMGTRNRIQHHPQLVPFDYPLSELLFQASKKSWGIKVRHIGETTWWEIRVIHVHSKIHQKITRRFVARTLSLLNRGRSRRIVYPTIGAYRLIAKRTWRHLGFLIASNQVRSDQVRRIKDRCRNTGRAPS